MHPDVVSADEGKCPDCGKKLMPTTGVIAFTCPMHPAVVSAVEGKCPDCGMKLMPTAVAASFTCPMHPEVLTREEGKCPECGMKLMPASPAASATVTADQHHDAHSHHHGHATTDGIEWEDDMVEVNRTTTPSNTRWKLVDRTTGAANDQIDWRFRVGDQVKLRLVNEMDSDHPMHHPFHIHGAGRFLVLDRDGAEDPTRTSCGPTRCSCAPARRSTSSST
jgi:FtsP/CotA-like multicopper oxidase with cupredoxin domain